MKTVLGPNQRSFHLNCLFYIYIIQNSDKTAILHNCWPKNWRIETWKPFINSYGWSLEKFWVKATWIGFYIDIVVDVFVVILLVYILVIPFHRLSYQAMLWTSTSSLSRSLIFTFHIWQMYRNLWSHSRSFHWYFHIAPVTWTQSSPST